jgi:PAS domain S-box-containing protein
VLDGDFLAQSSWLEMNFMPKTSKDMRHEATRQEYITRAVFSLTGYGLLFTIIISVIVNIVIGQPMWWPVILMLEMGVLILLGSLLVRTKRWRVARYLIPLIFILLGSYITAQPSLGVAGILEYALAVILTAILFNTKSQWLTVLLSVLAYLSASWVSREYNLATYVSIGLIVTICLSGVAILQWLSSMLLTRALEDLSEEMTIRNESEAKLRQKENILAATAKSAQLLLDATDWRSKINELLALLGNATNASHAYLFENHLDQNGKPATSQKYEWVAEGQVSEIDNPGYQNVPLLEEKMTDWFNTVRQGKPFYNTTKAFEAGWADTFSRNKIKTLLDVPIFVDGRWWGVLGFDDCVNEMPWSQAEVDAVQISAGLLGSAIKNQAANEELRASEDKFQTAFHETFVPMAIGRISDRVILDSNEAFLNLIGYTREESIHKTATELKLWSSEDEYRQYQQLMSGQGYLREFKARIRKKTGQHGVVLLSVSAIRINNEDCLLYTLYEITKLESALNELQNKNNELERFTYTVSHDLKAPLITIGGFAGILKRDITSGNVEKVQGSVNRIMDAVTKMERLLNELLELSRIGRIINKPEIVPFGMIVEEALSLTQGRLKANQVEVRVEADMPSVKVDRARIAEVIQNLVDNASKFMGEQEHPTIEIGTKIYNESQVFFIRDNGIGIESEYQERVFGLFNKLDSNTDGTGIGLALVKRIIEIHDSQIWIESEGKGKGTTFLFSLPQG